MQRLVYGVGHNDSQEKVHNCPYYRTWVGMLGRCYRRTQKAQESYKGCSVTEEWLTFSKFKGWMERQDWQGKELDKDLLEKGNKIYSPNSCIFVPLDVNVFITEPRKTNGLPVGVSWSTEKKTFRASCCPLGTGRSKHLGYFDTPEEAHLAWRRFKHQQACMLAMKQDDKRVVEALRKRYEEETW